MVATMVPATPPIVFRIYSQRNTKNRHYYGASSTIVYDRANTQSFVYDLGKRLD